MSQTGIPAVSSEETKAQQPQQEDVILQKIVRHTDMVAINKNKLTNIPLQPADEKSDFIHCTESTESTRDKIKKFYPGQDVNVYKLSVAELEKQGFILKMEANPGGTTKYPHIYHKSGERKPLPVSATIGCPDGFVMSAQ